ncbi:M1 family metallopeptidase [Flavobacterium sp.]|jgi:hypothetical protein|uniref:M1 family metallopeptidase n=1 Tax=Flavobacterium sp. TaxID=239 RepID=UPI0037BE92AD
MKLYRISSIYLLLTASIVCAQTVPEKQQGKLDTNKFRQMYDLMATPNMYRTASGAPGPEYYQQQADYKMDIVLDDKLARLSGVQTITYHNNAKESLEYLWLQLDQNSSNKNSVTKKKGSSYMDDAISVNGFSKKYLEQPADRGFNIMSVTDEKGKALSYTINETMMRINLVEPLKHGSKMVFTIKWWFNINNYMVEGGRSGYEHFEKDGNNLYVLAQFFPRMAVYNDVEGWQNMQFWGSGEFALTFGNYDVNVTVPADHIMNATGVLQNKEQVFTAEQLKRLALAEKSFDNPVIIVTQEEAEKAEKGFSNQTKTWRWKAENVRDFGISTSRKFIYDAMAVKLGNRTVMAESLYPKEGNPLWEQYSTRAVAHTLKSYSSYTFDYPYPKAVSVNAEDQGMEYPMICWNFGRPGPDGKTPDQTKYGMISVIIHEVGHNYFPMIVNSDERQWTWMDEGLNTFLQYLAERTFEKNYPSRRGPARLIVPYMKGDQRGLEPIMTNSESIIQFGNNAYGKPATALNILRETVMGPELFDYAFKTYANRWKFKHPTPEDFFRTMEDASAVDLDWFWRGWFYSTDYNDIGIKEVKQFTVTDKLPEGTKVEQPSRRRRFNLTGPMVYATELEGADRTKSANVKEIKPLKEYLEANFTKKEIEALNNPNYFYQVTFDKPGGLVMPLLVDLILADGTVEKHRFPAQVWQMNDAQVTRTFATSKQIIKIIVDADLETADIDVTNNTWPKEQTPSKFD